MELNGLGQKIGFVRVVEMVCIVYDPLSFRLERRCFQINVAGCLIPSWPFYSVLVMQLIEVIFKQHIQI